MFGSIYSNRWDSITRHYALDDVASLRGSKFFELPKQKWLSDKLYKLLSDAFENKSAVKALGALTGNQAVQQALSGLKAIYVSGWQVAADNNTSGNMYPDQSLYPSDSVPVLVDKINKSLARADQRQYIDGNSDVDYFVPIIADAEAGFGGSLNAYELMRSMILAGAAGVHFEDQLSSAKKCGHLGGKVLVPAREFIEKLKAARLAADVANVPTILIARTDANSARLLTSDIDETDHKFIVNSNRTYEGFYNISGGLEMAIERGLQYAPYADLLWCETSTPDLVEAKEFAEAIHSQFPKKMLAYNCSPSFNWATHVDKTGDIYKFQDKLAEMGYVFQFITLAGFHSLNTSMFKLATAYAKDGMGAYSKLQNEEFDLQQYGFSAVKHQSFVGTKYFDKILKIINTDSSTTSMDKSTETEQF